MGILKYICYGGFNRLNSDINYMIIYQTKKKGGAHIQIILIQQKWIVTNYTGAKVKYKMQHAKLQHGSN